jgi:hypothetical protein
MITNFTFDDLILYNYKELPSEKIEALEASLFFDEQLKEAQASILEIKKLLNSEIRKPSDTSIRLILDYNKQNRNELETI